MNRNVAEAARSAGHIAENITSVSDAATATTLAMTDARTAMDEVARMASSVSASVHRFRY